MRLIRLFLLRSWLARLLVCTLGFEWDQHISATHLLRSSCGVFSLALVSLWVPGASKHFLGHWNFEG